MRFNLKISEKAYKDIKNIYAYIARDNVASAQKVEEKIFETIESVSVFPNIGAKITERFGIESKYSYFVVLPYPYLVFYIFDGKTVFVDRVLDGRRDYLKIL